MSSVTVRHHWQLQVRNVGAAPAHSVGPDTVDDWLVREPPRDGSRLEPADLLP